MSRVANTGAAANFTLTNTVSFQLMAEFVTDGGDPALLSIPAGSWNFSFYFSSSNNSDDPQFYVELLKYDGTTFTSIATGIASPETITNGTTIDLYNTSITIPSSTVLTLTDRLVIRVYVDTDGNRTITFYTQATRLAEVFTTFTTGLTALNGLTAQVQSFANGSSGTAPAFVSSTATHTLNIPLASAASVTAGLISNTDYTTFSNKITNPMTTLGDIIYGGASGTPTPLPIGTTNQVLAVVGGIPSWTSAGAGDVVGPAGATDGDFAIFSGTTGKLIAEPTTAAFNNSTGRATFNGGVDVGVSSSTTGTIIFRNSSNAFTTTVQASTSAAASINYYWPTTAPTAGQILSSDASGNLSWTAAGSGDMTTTTNQTVTGVKTFGSAGNVGKLVLAGSTSGTTILNAAAIAGSTTVTLPALTGTVALLENAQTFSGAKTFSSALTISSAGSTTTGQLTFSGATNNWIDFGLTGFANPAVGTRSVGTKIVLYKTLSGSVLDHAIGQGASHVWFTTSSTSSGFEFYQQTAASTNRSLFIDFAFTTVLSAFRYTNQTTSAQIRANITAGQLTQNFISFGTGDVSNVGTCAAVGTNYGTRSLGTRFILQQTGVTTNSDYAFGVEGTQDATSNAGMWCSIQNTSQYWKWMVTSNTIMTLTGGGTLTLTGAIIGAASQDVFNTTSTTVNFAGAATTLNIGTTTSAITALNIGTGAGTANKTINIGTAATAGTTTINIGSSGGATNTIAIRGNLTLGTSGGNMGFYGTSAIAKPTTSVTAAAFVQNSGTAVNDASTFGGYTLGKVVAALQNLGLLT